MLGDERRLWAGRLDVDLACIVFHVSSPTQFAARNTACLRWTHFRYGCISAGKGARLCVSRSFTAVSLFSCVAKLLPLVVAAPWQPRCLRK
jgi:hypothetical protein